MKNMYLILILAITMMGLGCANTDGTEVPRQEGSGKQKPAEPEGQGTAGPEGQGTAGPEGQGTAGPKQTLTPQQEFREKLVAHESFSLTNDLTLEEWESVESYSGKLEGNGKKLTIKSFKAGAQGLISEIAQKGEVKDLTIELQADFATGTDAGPAGVLAAVNKGKVEGVKITSTGTVKVKSENTNAGSSTGGLIGKNEGSVTKCSSSVAVEGRLVAGGLVGNNQGEIKESYATGNVSSVSRDSDAGGLVGKNIGPQSKIENSYYTSGNVEGTTRVGGLIGRNTGEINKCYSNAQEVKSTEAQDKLGRFAGYNINMISNSFVMAIKSLTKDIGSGESNGVTTIADITDITTATFTDWAEEKDADGKAVWEIEKGKWPKLKNNPE